MHIAKILETRKPCISFEFFPPKTAEASEALFKAIQELITLKPGYVSVTYGAGGGTRQLTHDLIIKIQQETSLTVVSHLTTVGHSRAEIGQILDLYAASGIENIMALRGDQPADGFAHAGDLVAFIKQRHPGMGIGVAGFPEGHPATPNRLREIEYLKAKVDRGADYICTQLFFENRDFYDFVERCEIAGIRVPIVAGIMPITTASGFERMADLAAGARFPARLQRALARAEDEDAFRRVGLHWATEQVRDLIDNGVPGIHFYTLNRSRPTLEIHRALGVSTAESLAR